MKVSLKILISFAIALTLSLGSCAPKATDRHFENPETAFAPDLKDVRLNLRLRELGEAPPDLQWKGAVSTASFFSQAENLIRIGDENQRPSLRDKGLAWIRRFYQVPNSTLMADMGTSPYIGLAAAQVEPEVQSKLSEILLQMEVALPVVQKHVLELGKKLPPPSKKGIEELLVYAKSLTKAILVSIPRMHLPPPIAEGFKIELIKNTDPLFATVDSLLRQLRAAKTLSEAITLVNVAIKTLKVQLSPQLAQSMEQGKKLALALDQLKDAQGALTVIVDIWLILTPKERLQQFKPVNAQLYSFLLKQSSSDLECLRTRGCLGGPFDGLEKKLFVLPKIERYGVPRLKEQLTTEALSYVSASIDNFAGEFIPKVPLVFSEEIQVAWHAKALRLDTVRGDFQSYLNRIATDWSKEILPATNGKVPGFETAYIRVAVSRHADLSLQALPQPLNLTGEVAGASLSANVYLMENARPKDDLALRAALSQINKIVAYGGYRNADDKLVPALLAPVAHKGALLDIVHFETVKTPNYSYRVPDHISLQDAFLASPSMNYARNFSVSGLSAQIKGLSQSLLFTADWKNTSFDRILGAIKAQDLAKEVKDPSLQQSLFPKDKLFALNMGTVSVLLQELKKKMTPVFLLTLDKKVLWADQYFGTDQDIPVMAGVVDIKEGKRIAYAETREVAKFTLALAEFVEALDGIENTQSPILLKRNAKGTRPLDSIISGREDLKHLVIALANFIAKKMKTPQSHVNFIYDLNHQNAVSGVIRVETQSFAIRALVKAYELSRIESYLWSAQSLYYAMNKNLYSVKSEFYVNSDATELDFPDKITTLLALSELKPYLPEESRQQLQKLMVPWLDALAALR